MKSDYICLLTKKASTTFYLGRMSASQAVTLLVLLTLVQSSLQPSGCRAGQRFLMWSNEGLPICQRCPKRTFMDEDYHYLNTCKPCQDFTFDSCVKVLSACQPDSDTKIECKENCYEEIRPSEKTMTPCQLCRLCPEGEYLTRNCTKTSNTVCCPYPNMIVVDDVSNTADVAARCEHRTQGNTTTTNAPAVENTSQNEATIIRSDDGSNVMMSGWGIAIIIFGVVFVVAVIVRLTCVKSPKSVWLPPQIQARA